MSRSQSERTIRITEDNQDNPWVVSIQTCDEELNITKKYAREMLKQFEPCMKSRGHFLMVFAGKAFRSYDVKSIVRILRKVFKNG